ncbi:MAG: VWA domain-containing protein [Chloroflexi bacterium]|nr:VWA domain-containing protein [Chloroflexota bacterium]
MNVRAHIVARHVSVARHASVARHTRVARYAILIGVALLYLCSTVSPVTSQTPTGISGLDIVLVIDESGSMWEGNDPQIKGDDGQVTNPGWRIVGANLLAEWLGVDQSGAQHQLSVIMFGTDAKIVWPLQPIQDTSAQEGFHQALSDAHTYLGATDILEVLRLAKGELDKGRTDPNVKRIVIFLSDGKCEPKPVTTRAETEQCNQDIRELVQREFVQAGYPIFTIALTSDAFKQDPDNTIYKNVWQEMAVVTSGEYFEPVKAERELLDAYVSILQRLFGLAIQNPPPPVDAPTELTFDVPDNLLQVAFAIIKYQLGIQTIITRPDGTVVQPGDSGVQYFGSPLTDSYGISRPTPGKWTVKLTGRGKVSVINIPYPKTRYLVERLSPAAAHPQGKPMDISVRVLDVDQQPKSLQELSVAVGLPDGTSVPLPLNPAGASSVGSYAGVLEDTHQLGTYVLNFDGKQDNTSLSDQQTIKVVAAPWIKIVEPVLGNPYPGDVPLLVQAQLMYNTAPLTDLNSKDQFEVIARLVRPDGQVVDTQFLRLQSGGIFSGSLNASGDGDYIVRTQLSYLSESGEQFQDVSELAVSVSGLAPTAVPPTAVPTPSPPPEPAKPLNPAVIAGIAGGLVVLALLGLVIVWWRSKPALVGSLEVEGVPYALRGKRSITLGADPHNRILVQGQGVLPRHAELRPVGSGRNAQVIIRSLDRNNPVLVNGLEVPSHTLQDEDKITVGDQTLTYSGPERFDELSSTLADGDKAGGSGDWKF